MQRRRSRLPAAIQRQLIEHFVAGTPARTVADLIGVHRNTATLYYRKLREVIAQRVEDQSPFAGEVELDESYFGSQKSGKRGPHRRRGRGAPGKVPVFGILKRGGRVYTVMVPNVARATLMPIIHQRVQPDSVVYTDGFASYDVLDVSGFRHHRVDHNRTFVEEGSAQSVHINGIENFWNQAKRHLRRYNGIPKAQFPLFLKECEWRFNSGAPRQLRTQLQEWMELE